MFKFGARRFFNKQMLLWLIPILVGAGIICLLPAVEDVRIAKILIPIVGGVVILFGVGGGLQHWIEEKELWDSAIYYTGKTMLYTSELTRTELLLAQSYTLNLDDPLKHVRRRMQYCYPDSAKEISNAYDDINIVYVAIKPRGEVTYKMGEHTYKAHGLAFRGDKCEVELLSESTTKSVLYHELTHIMLFRMRVPPRQHHEFMKPLGW